MSDERLTPAQSVTREIMAHTKDVRFGNGSSAHLTADLALYLRSSGLSANTISPVITLGRRISNKISEPSEHRAIIELCADNDDPLADIAVNPDTDRDDMVGRFVDRALPFFPRRVLDALRRRADDLALYMSAEDILSRDALAAYRGEKEIVPVDPNKTDLPDYLFIDNVHGQTAGLFDPEYGDFNKAKELIERARVLQEAPK